MPGDTRYLILGPSEVTAGGSPVPIPGLKERAILGLLVVEAGTVVSSDRMIFELWRDDPPRTATATLRSHVSKLRRSLRPDHHIVTRRPGYQLDVDRSAIDAGVFEDLAGQARAASNPDDASRLADEALGLWRGNALADLTSFLFADSESRRLEELRLGVLELSIDADLTRGLHDDTIPMLRSLVALHPYHERFWAQLMLSLYRSGRAGDALDTYREATQVLGESLGIGLSADLQSLERAIVVEDPSLGVAGGIPPHNLPATTSSFVGRRQDIEALTETLSKTRMVTLTGAGGCGKSRLALETATRLLPRFADGVWRAELAPLDDPEAVAAAVSAALGEPASHSDDPLGTLIDYLAHRTVLLILDNCEHLLDACAELTSQITDRCPGVVVLATSREPLRVAGETVWLVPHLDLPNPVEPAEAQEEAEAFRLFADRAGEADARFGVTEDNRDDITQVCWALSGLPLAIELAAAQCNAFTPAQILERLSSGLDVLAVSRRNAVAHHRTMRMAIEWSTRLLDADEARFFEGLAVFRGGWHLDEATSVLTDPDQPADAAAVLLGSLVERSLVDVVRGTERRYRLLEPIRELALEELESSGRGPALRERHARQYLALAELADRGLRGPDQARWLERMESDHDNIKAALAWTLETGRADLALPLVAASAWFWFMAGHWRDAWSWLTRSFEVAAPEHADARAVAVYRAGAIQVIRNNSGPVLGLLEGALDIARSNGDREGEAWCLHLLGHSYLFETNPDAGQLMVDGREIFAELGMAWEVAWSDRYIGDSLAVAGQMEAAIELQQLSISAFREMGDLWSTSYGLHNLGGLLFWRSEFGPAAARPYFERCLRLARQLHDPVWTAHGLLGVANCDHVSGSGNATMLYPEIQERLRLIGDDNCLTTALGYFGESKQEAGDAAGAATLYAEAIRIARRIGHTRALAMNLDRLGRLAYEIGEQPDAIRLAGAVETALDRGDVTLGEREALAHRRFVESLGSIVNQESRWEDSTVYALELAERIAAGP